MKALKALIVVCLFALSASSAEAYDNWVKSFSGALSPSGVSASVSIDRDMNLSQVLIKADEAISETVTITLNSNRGANYDTVLAESTLVNATSFVFRPDGVLALIDGDAIDVAVTSDTSGTVYGSVYLEKK